MFGSQAFGNFLKHIYLYVNVNEKGRSERSAHGMEAVDTTHRVPGYSGLGSTTRIKNCTF